jgi:hypothetical protein
VMDHGNNMHNLTTPILRACRSNAGCRSEFHVNSCQS